eukprot:11700066-Alexandrium_andersonii.AAC.1
MARSTPPRHRKGGKRALLTTPRLGDHGRQSKVGPLKIAASGVIGLDSPFSLRIEHFPPRLLAPDHGKLDQLSFAN